jgi:hypothetical protein
MLVEFRHQPDSVFLHRPRGLVAILVILEPVFYRQSSHADVEARLLGIPVWIAAQDRAVLRNLWIEQDYVDAVMEFLSQALAWLACAFFQKGTLAAVWQDK